MVTLQQWILPSSKQRIAFNITLLALFIGAISWFNYHYIPLGVDWEETFQPAALKLLTGHSPYEVNSFYNAPWVLIPLIPFALLPTRLGFALWGAVSLCLVAFVAIKRGANLVSLLAFLLSYPILYNCFYGQIDALIYLGFVASPSVGLFLLLAKPQIGIGISIFWGIAAWQKEGLRGVLRLLVPVTLAFGLSFFIFGPWFLNASKPIGRPWDTSLWPQAIPIGLALLIYALRKKTSGMAIASSPFLSPYCGANAWAASLLGLLPNHWETLAASLGIWIAVIFNGGWL